jgi:SulP family sulfate permease
MFKFDLASLRGDIYGGVTAAVVALPLSLAFGVASGAGAISGLYGAIAVGFFAAVFGGTRSQVSGPTGPMTVVMASIVTLYSDNLAQAFTIVLLGGALQIVFGLLRVGRYISYTPYSVVSGFMTGIGVIIMLIQTLPFFGLPTAGGPVASIESWSRILAEINFAALALASLSLAIMILWPRPWRTVLPPPLAALIIGTLAGVFLLPTAPIIGDVPTGLPQIVTPYIDPSRIAGVVQAAIILAILGSIDSLLTSLIADTITRSRHNSDKELVGQGIGNMIAGLIGGLPGAGATMRTVVNIRAGGTTGVSGALHALILFALVLGLAPLAEVVPHAVLAGILIKVGWDIIDWDYLKRARYAPRDKLFVMVVTFLLTVFVDLITAVAVGIILASFVTTRWMEAEQLKGVAKFSLPNGDDPLSEEERALLTRANGDVALFLFRGSFSYASARELARRAGTETAGHSAIVYDFSDAGYVDTSVALSVDDLIGKSNAEHLACFVSGVDGPTGGTLQQLKVLDRVPAERRFKNRVDAVRAAVAEAEKRKLEAAA